ncbi:HK97 family phage prohead protease [Vibrio sp. SCSIO 43136]|uniref:HK97 family phage prohead protease n=1 Tax=Vibrio sp. SCSIO 43136 TaxID=2819101 RepID=UPI00207643C4|nr:HK97 family phage prohead protease [Vibrio sp. SCSIO 43136]USD68130.1 HK97 family phage prohead protease [Vibrio sp. SCSIO 43136]
MKDGSERRYFMGEVRAAPADGDKAATIGGLGIVYNKRSEDLGGFVEIIRPGAAAGLLDGDVRCFFNHNPNYILGRTAAGTLELRETDEGVEYVATPPDTQTVRDLVLEPISRGDVTGSSFIFRVSSEPGAEKWYEDNGVLVREIFKLASLKEIGPVSMPAYTDSTTAKRSLEEHQSSEARTIAKAEHEARQRDMQIRGI